MDGEKIVGVHHCLSFPSYESVNLKVDNVKIVLMT